MPRPSRLCLVGAVLSTLVVGCGSAAPTSSASPSISPSISTSTSASTSEPGGSPLDVSSAPQTPGAGTDTADVQDEDTTTSPTAETTGSPVVVPVTTALGTDGTPRVLVEISVGGGSPVPVVLDTGSSGLMIDSAAVGTEVDSTGATPFTKNYVNASLSGSVVQAPVSIGGVTTPPIGVVSFTAGTASAGLTAGIGRGILGIASEGQAGGTAALWSPAMQLPAPFDTTSTLDLAASGAGTWTLGPVATPADPMVLPLVPVSGAPDTPGRWAKDVALCWTFPSAAATCGPTDLDSGASAVLVNAGILPGVAAESSLPSGGAVSLTTPDNQQLWSFTITDQQTAGKVEIQSLGQTHFNTGLGFFFDHLVSFDYAAGTLTLSAK